MTASCKHFRKFKNSTNNPNKFMENCKIICDAIVYPESEMDRKRKAKIGRCDCCQNSKPLLCVYAECVFFGCVKDGHFSKHFEQKSNHYIGVDITFGQLYCSHCKDFVYDKECEDERRKYENALRDHLHKIRDTFNQTKGPARRRRP